MMFASATCPEDLLTYVLNSVKVTNCQVIRAATPRPEISYNVHVHPNEEAAESALLQDVATATKDYAPHQKALVFVRRTDTVERLAAKLGCTPFHRGLAGGLEDTWKTFVSGRRGKVLVCSSIVGVGVDIPGVHDVWHFGMPWNLIDYVQETGRAGRDGTDAFSHLLTWNDDINAPSSNYTEGDLRRMVSQTDECRRTIMGKVLDGCPTSCALLRRPNLCDNCRRKVDEARLRPTTDTPRPPLPNHRTRSVQLQHPPRGAPLTQPSSSRSTSTVPPPPPPQLSPHAKSVQAQRAPPHAPPPPPYEEVTTTATPGPVRQKPHAQPAPSVQDGRLPQYRQPPQSGLTAENSRINFLPPGPPPAANPVGTRFPATTQRNLDSAERL